MTFGAAGINPRSNPSLYDGVVPGRVCGRGFHGQQVIRWDVARPDHAPTPTQVWIRARIDPMRPTCLNTWVVSRAAESLGVGNMAVVSGVCEVLP